MGELLHYVRAERKIGLDVSPEQIARGKDQFPHFDLRVGAGETVILPEGPFDVIILSDVLNYAADVEVLLRRLHALSHQGTRLLINVYNTLWRPLLGSARKLGLAAEQPASNWLSKQDVINLCSLADWEVFKSFGAILVPLPLGPVSRFLNRWIAPLVELALPLDLSDWPSRRPSAAHSQGRLGDHPGPKRSGSIAQAIERVPRLGGETELIFIEGHSKDNTWEVIKALPDSFAHGRIVKLQQSGKGKGNAVIEGFRAATGDILDDPGC